VLVATGTAPGLYGGSGDLKVCDPQKLVDFLNEHPDKAKAFASVLGITPEGIGDYVATLSPVVLLSDTLVMNHGFKGGKATEVSSVLQAGTAVMVDRQGVPRVKCNCGNPLTEPEVLPTGDWSTRGEAWDGYDAARVTGVVAGDSVDEFTMCDLATGTIEITHPVMSRSRWKAPASSPPPTSHARRTPRASRSASTSAGARSVTVTSGRPGSRGARENTQTGLPGYGHSPNVRLCS
jgi:hypothetical protein